MFGQIKIDRSRRTIFRELDDCESSCEEIIHFDSSGEERSYERRNFEDSVDYGDGDEDSVNDGDDDESNVDDEKFYINWVELGKVSPVKNYP